MIMTRSIQFIFCFVICSVPSLTFSQDVSVKAIDDTQAVRALTDEMRQLRIMLQKASLFGYKIQIIFEKMKMQNDNVYKIKQDLSKVVDDINEKTRELDRDTERLKDANKSSNSQSSSMLSDQKEDNNELAEIVVEEKQTIDYLTNKEGQLKYQLDKEQSILDNLSAKVDLMEQSIAK